MLVGQWETLDKTNLAPRYKNLIQNSYDSCLHSLDKQLGVLFETLKKRGILDNTVVIVTSDHGESLGEHALYEHGESLYRPEIQIPLLVVLPKGKRTAAVVKKEVSLIDLPATILDLTNMADAKPTFPGRSLAAFWRESSADANQNAVFSELSSPNPINPSFGHSPARHGPLVSIAEEDYVYIRNQRDGREQLFHAINDPGEATNLAKLESMRPRIERFRERLGSLASDAAKEKPE